MQKAMSQKGEIIELVAAINACWVEGRFDDLHRYFHDGMTLAMPGFEQHVQGAEGIVGSYRDFGAKSHVHEFEPGEPHVEVLESAGVAMATTPFAIDYDFEGTRYRETGTDVLAFVNVDGRWRVWWRTIVPGSSETV